MEGSSARRCMRESAWLLVLAVALPVAVTAVWEARARQAMAQRRLARECMLDRPAALSKLGPLWSSLLKI